MMKTAADTQEHICLSCSMGAWDPDCGGDELEFGDGYGLDNIIGCDAFEAGGGVPESGWQEERPVDGK